ncbi:medium-chain fatty acid-CoA ligase faa2 [Mycoemilia scoparia]|uniref:Medium-chain fatty acid-CoA ligase faa2 n=1 Tax=Mycoemilia scoparia TaxID=417184 RepID=A0A9W7ZSH2_9FUNG|nr:medium-chain fatty acid-CoA ligase faa2 [Mycoemilia scoparia]
MSMSSLFGNLPTLKENPVIEFSTLILTIGALVLGYFYFTAYSPWATRPDTSPLLLKKQSYVAKKRSSESETATYRSASNNLPGGTPLATTYDADVRTLRDAFSHGQIQRDLAQVKTAVKYFAAEDDKDATLVKPQELDDLVRKFKNGLTTLIDWPKNDDGSEPKTKTLALVLPSSIEWLAVYRACIDLGIVVIPIPDTLKRFMIVKILEHSKTSVIVASTELVGKLAANIKNVCPQIKTMIVDKPLDNSPTSIKIQKVANIISLEQITNELSAETATAEEDPSSNGEAIKISPNSPAYIIYNVERLFDTPSAIIITHSNALSAVTALLAHFPGQHLLTPKDNFMCTSPMAVTKTLNFINLVLTVGCTLSIYETQDGEKFINQAFILSPTFTYLTSIVSRDCSDLLRSNVEKYPKVEGWMFKHALSHRKSTLRAGYISRWTFWDLAYFSHYNNFIGGRMRAIFVAQDTFACDVEQLRLFFGCQVLTLIGTDSTTGVVSCTKFFDYGHVVEGNSCGPPLTCNEIKLVKVDYDSSNDDHQSSEKKSSLGDTISNLKGQIYVRGPNVVTTYWNNSSESNATNGNEVDKEVPTAAKPLVDKEGWHATGLIASLLPNRTLKYIGHIDDVITDPNSTPTSTSYHCNYYYLREVEEILLQSSYITQIAISFDEKRKHCNIIVYPTLDTLLGYARKNKKQFKFSRAYEYSWCLDLIRSDIKKVGNENGLGWLVDSPDKDVRLVVRITTDMFGQDKSLVLPNDCIDRSVVKNRFPNSSS